VTYTKNIKKQQKKFKIQKWQQKNYKKKKENVQKKIIRTFI